MAAQSWHRMFIMTMKIKVSGLIVPCRSSICLVIGSAGSI